MNVYVCAYRGGLRSSHRHSFLLEFEKFFVSGFFIFDLIFSSFNFIKFLKEKKARKI